MKLYVSTYAKYNRGSLAGAWLDLDNYRNADEFAAACRRLHRDERDPEIMFQDCETDPGADWQEGLYSGSSIPREYWTLKAEAEAERAKAARRPKSADKVEQEALFEAWWADTVKCGAYSDNPKDKEWHRKENARFFRLEDGGIVAIKKPCIETRFCFGEDERGQGGDGPGTMKYAIEQCRDAETKAGFMAHNLESFDSWRTDLFGRAEKYSLRVFSTTAWWRQNHMGPDYTPTARAIATMERWKEPDPRNPEFSITEKDKAAIVAAYNVVRDQFVKRLEAWWKRYGASHIHTWTYWTEA